MQFKFLLSNNASDYLDLNYEFSEGLTQMYGTEG